MPCAQQAAVWAAQPPEGESPAGGPSQAPQGPARVFFRAASAMLHRTVVQQLQAGLHPPGWLPPRGSPHTVAACRPRCRPTRPQGPGRPGLAVRPQVGPFGTPWHDLGVMPASTQLSWQTEVALQAAEAHGSIHISQLLTGWSV